MQVLATSNSALEAPATRAPLVGQASLSSTPTVEQTRLLVFILASHNATATKFREVCVPLKLLFPGLSTKDRDKAVRMLFDDKSPGLVIRATDEAGRLIQEGSFCMMPLLSCLSFRKGSRHVRVTLNSRLLDYLPQFLQLVPQGMPVPVAPSSTPLQLAA